MSDGRLISMVVNTFFLGLFYVTPRLAVARLTREAGARARIAERSGGNRLVEVDILGTGQPRFRAVRRLALRRIGALAREIDSRPLAYPRRPILELHIEHYVHELVADGAVEDAAVAQD